jgi:class 3 adenylate cyclase
MHCPSCNHDYRPGAKFCDECGATIHETTPPTLAPAPAAPPALAPAVATASPPPLAAVPPSPPRPQHRLAAADWLLLGTLLPVCVFGIVMTVVHGVRGDFVVAPFWVSSAPDAQSYPIVRQVLSPSGEGSTLAAGDHLRRLEGSDLNGVSSAGFALRRSQAAQAGARSLLLTIERGSVRSDVRVPLVPGFAFPGTPWWATLPFVVGSVGTALLLLVRAAHWHLARRNYVASLLVAAWATPYFVESSAAPIVRVLGAAVACGLTLWNVNEFLPGLGLWGPGQRALAWALALLFSAWSVGFFWLPDGRLAAMLMRLGGVAAAGLVIAFLVALMRVYQRADPLGRRQIKWVVYGFYVPMLPLGLFFAVLSRGVAPEWVGALFAVATIAAVAVPLGLLVAIAFYQFLDIDRLFSATLSYSILAILSLAVVLGVMPVASRALGQTVGLDPSAGQVILSFVLAAVVVPAQRRLRPQIERLFFRDRYTLERGIEALLHDLASCAGPEELLNVTGERLDALLRPESCVIYARAGQGYAPAFVRGRVVPVAFDGQSPLISTLRSRTGPIVTDPSPGRRASALAPFDRAVLETLGAQLVLPVDRGTDLVALVCLGRKRSGDVYTSTDLALLAGVGHALSSGLLRFDDARIIRDSRAMQEALRRYVPAPLVAQLAGGASTEAVERDVSALFVDIRGYSTYAEARNAEEVFLTSSRFADAVSRVVREHGGSVVEFSGDGVMALFGVPESSARKERDAVQAGRELVAVVGSLVPAGSESGRPLSIGVGIATGPAFVGDIEAADRRIWTAVGNTINLAARLQALTRDLDAAIVIDDVTWHAASAVAADFVRRTGVSIRGLATQKALYVLPFGHWPERAPAAAAAEGCDRVH